MSGTLNFSTGEQTFKVNDTAEIRFNPMDADFVQRFTYSLEDIDRIRENYKGKIIDDMDPKEAFKLSDSCNKEIRAEIDKVFGDGTCAAIFGNVNVNSMADNLPIWLNFYFAVLDVIENQASNANENAQVRLNEYKKRYGKYMKK